MNKIRKILYVFPRVVDTVIQNTTENEIARAMCRLNYKVDTVVAYESVRTPLDGFSQIEYVHKHSSGLWSTLRYHWVLLKRMLTTDADVVLVNYPAMHLLPLAKILHIGPKHPLWFMDIRSVPVDVGKDLRSRMLLFRYRLAIFIADQMCDGMTVITPALGETVKPLLTRLEKIGIWESGVTLEHFDPATKNLRKELGLEGRMVLMYHGIMSPNRGLRNLVEAVALVAPAYPDLRLLLVGDGPCRLELEQLVSDSAALQGVVSFVNSVPYSQIGRYIATADLGVLPFPNIEWWAVSSPLKLMEYLAMGLPVIATDIRAIRHVTERTGGAILAENDAPASLAQAIRIYIEKGCVPPRHDILEDNISWNAQARALDRYIQAH